MARILAQIESGGADAQGADGRAAEPKVKIDVRLPSAPPAAKRLRQDQAKIDARLPSAPPAAKRIRQDEVKIDAKLPSAPSAAKRFHQGEVGEEFLKHLYERKSMNTAKAYACGFRKLVRLNGGTLDGMTSESFSVGDCDINMRSALAEYCRFVGCEPATPRGAAKSKRAAPAASGKLHRPPRADCQEPRSTSTVVRTLTPADEAEIGVFTKSLQEHGYSKPSRSVYCHVIRRLIKFEDKSLDEIGSESFLEQLQEQGRQGQVCSSVLAFCRFRAGEFVTKTRDATSHRLSSVSAAAASPKSGVKKRVGRPSKVAVQSITSSVRSSTPADAVAQLKRERAEASVAIKGFPFAMWRKALIDYAKLACSPLIPQHAVVSYEALDNNKFAIVEFESQAAAGEFLEAAATQPLHITVMFQQHELTAHWASEVLPADD